MYLQLALSLTTRFINNHSDFSYLIEKTLSTGVVDLSNKDLTSFPLELLTPPVEQSSVKWWQVEPLTVIRARNNQLHSLPDLSEFPSLKELSFSNNKISSVSFSSELPELTLLVLRQNLLISLPDLSFLPCLSVLDVSHNYLSTVSNCSLPNLVSLEASHNKITSVAGLSLPQIRKVDLSYNSLTDLDDVFFGDSLEELDVSFNQLSRVPRLCSNSRLKILNCNHNQLSSIDDDNLPISIIELFLNQNLLSVFPCSLLKCCSLSILCLASNTVSTVPDEIQTLTNLTVLDLSNNSIKVLNPFIGKLAKLRSLEVTGNPLRSPGIAIVRRGFKSLIESLRNKLPADTTMDNGAHQSVVISSHLTTLDLSNRISDQFPDLSDCNLLRQLNLSGNDLNQLNFSLLSLLSSNASLLLLDLSKCRLTVIQDNFHEFTHLKELNLSSNQLTSLPQSLINHDSLKNLNVSFNQRLGDFLSSQILNMAHLTRLELQGIGLTCIPEINSNDLCLINVSDNSIDEISTEFLRKNSEIQDVNIENNNVSSLPDELAFLSSLKSLSINGNPLRSIRPSIRVGGSAKIISYLKKRAGVDS
ncbi:hypothetical protein GEMRC1_002875 [Eukaryota sp. GEM-RC1]